VRRAFCNSSDRRLRGESYASSLYEAIVPAILERVAASAALATEVVSGLDPKPVDVLGVARIRRERERASLRFAHDQDLPAFQSVLAHLDEEERLLVDEPRSGPTAAEARAYLEDLPRLWRETTDEGRRGRAQALFERIDVLGATDFTITLTPEAEAHGFAQAFGAEFRCLIVGTGRGERIRGDTIQLSIRIERQPVTNVPRYVHRVSEIA